MARWVTSPKRGGDDCCDNALSKADDPFSGSNVKTSKPPIYESDISSINFGSANNKSGDFDNEYDEASSLLSNTKEPVESTGSAGSAGLKILVFLCGLATFARSEAVLLQTVFFAQCREYGPQFFYPIAAALLFVPGPIVIAVVNMLERGSMTPVATRTRWKILAANATSAIAILFLILEIVLWDDESKKSKLAYLYMPVLGIGSSLHFQAMSQILAFFPPVYMTILLIGSYCPFIVYVPINAMGPLCAAEYDSTNTVLGVPCANASSSTFTGNAAVQLTCAKWETQWDPVWTFFGSAIVLCLQSVIAVNLLTVNRAAQPYIKKWDVSNACAIRDAREKSNGLENSSSKSAVAYEGQSRLRRALPQLYSTMIVTMASLLVTSQYGMIPLEGKIMYLCTYLLYEYYICSCIGSLLASWWPLGDTASVILSTLRCVVVPLTFAYEVMPGLPGLVIPRSDAGVLAVNFVFILTGAWIFASTFTVLQSKLENNTEDKKWALQLNNGLYFLAMIIAFGISIGIGYLVWGPDGQGP